MCLGSIYEHLSGCFAHISTNEYWLAPHFEKMLYRNAFLIELMTDVHKGTKSSSYKQRIYETNTYLLRDIKTGGLRPLASPPHLMRIVPPLKVSSVYGQRLKSTHC